MILLTVQSQKVLVSSKMSLTSFSLLHELVADHKTTLLGTQEVYKTLHHLSASDECVLVNGLNLLPLVTPRWVRSQEDKADERTTL